MEAGNETVLRKMSVFGEVLYNEGVDAAGSRGPARKKTGSGTGVRKAAALFLSLLGPGVISMLANNDAGGMISYTMTGATFGINFFIPLLFVFAPVSYIIQEFSMRLSAVTRREYRELVCERFGRGWSYSSMTVLVISNIMYTVAEFAGMTAGLTLLGLPMWLADLISLLLIASVTLFVGYSGKERLTLFVGTVNVAFIIVAVMTRPDITRITRAFTALPGGAAGLLGGGALVFILATLGNTIAPFMLYFQNNAAIDKELTASDIKNGRLDLKIGSALQPLFAAVAVICGAALVNDGAAENALDIINAFTRHIGPLGGGLFALGLFNCGWLAAITITFSTSYAVAGAFGCARSQNCKIKEALQFYGVFFGNLLIGAAVMLIPHLPLAMMAVFTHIICAGIMVPDIIILVKLTSDKRIMGAFANSGPRRAFGWAVAVAFALMAAVMIIALA